MKKILLFAFCWLTASTFTYAGEDSLETVVVDGPRIPPGGTGGLGILPIGGRPGGQSLCAEPSCGGTISRPEPGTGKPNGAQKEKFNTANKERAKKKKISSPGFWESVWGAIVNGSEQVASSAAGVENSRDYLDRLLSVSWSRSEVERDEYKREYKDGSIETGTRTKCTFEEINEPNRPGCTEIIIKPAPNPEKPNEKNFQVTIRKVYHVYAPSNPNSAADGYLAVTFRDDSLLFIVSSIDELENIIKSI